MPIRIASLTHRIAENGAMLHQATMHGVHSGADAPPAGQGEAQGKKGAQGGQGSCVPVVRPRRLARTHTARSLPWPQLLLGVAPVKASEKAALSKRWRTPAIVSVGVRSKIRRTPAGEGRSVIEYRPAREPGNEAAHGEDALGCARNGNGALAADMRCMKA